MKKRIIIGGLCGIAIIVSMWHVSISGFGDLRAAGIYTKFINQFPQGATPQEYARFKSQYSKDDVVRFENFKLQHYKDDLAQKYAPHQGYGVTNAGSFEALGGTIKSGAETAVSQTKAGFEKAGQQIQQGAALTQQAFQQAGQQIKLGFDRFGNQLKETFTKFGGMVEHAWQETERGLEEGWDKVKYGAKLIEAFLKGEPLKEGYSVTSMKDCMANGGKCFVQYMVAAQKSERMAWIGPFEEDMKDDPYKDVILKYRPMIYLHQDENILPITMTEHFCNPWAALIKSNSNSWAALRNPTNFVVIPRGQVTPQALYDVFMKRVQDARATKPYKNTPLDQLTTEQKRELTSAALTKDEYIDIPTNTPDIHDTVNYPDQQLRALLSGSNWWFVQGVKNITPVYVYAYEDSGLLYINYITYYAYNRPFPIYWKGHPIFVGDAMEFQDAHYGDMEHVTLELSKVKGQWVAHRMMFAAHASEEGIWLWSPEAPDRPANGEIYETLNGIRPIVYPAIGSHAIYPWGPGEYVRIFGFANDVVENGKNETKGVAWWCEWDPKLIRLYHPFDPKFDAKTMGVACLTGLCGPNGVPGLLDKGWFNDAKVERGTGFHHPDGTPDIEGYKHFYVGPIHGKDTGNSVGGVRNDAVVPGRSKPGWVDPIMALKLVDAGPKKNKKMITT